MVITMLVSGSALLVAAAGFIIFEHTTERQQMTRALEVTAAITAANSAAALASHDIAPVREALNSLKAAPDIVQASVYESNGRVFARYLRAGNPFVSPPAVQPPGCHFSIRNLELFHPIQLGGKTIGTIYFQEDLSQMRVRLWNYGLIGLLVLLVSSGIALFLSAWLHVVVSGPLSALAQTVTEVQSHKNYSVRATKHGDDEVSNLIDGFNEMLAQIQERDKLLELRVAERTQELADSLAVLNATLGASGDGILVVDENGKKLYQNRRTAELWKLPPAIATSDDAIAQRRLAKEATKDPERFEEVVNYYRDHPDVSGQDEIQLKDGTILERMTAPVLSQDGRNYGRIWTFHDVTQSRRYEAALRESQANYFSLVDQMPAGVFRKDKEGRFVFVNSEFCRYRDAKPEDFLGKMPMEVAKSVPRQPVQHSPESIGLFAAGTEHHLAIMQNGQPIVIDEKFTMTNGKTVQHHVVKSAVFGPDGKIVGSQAILLDITDLKQAESQIALTHQQLLETSRLAGMAEVATSVLHNVGNVLNSLNVSTTLVLDLVKKSRLNHFGRLAALIHDHRDDLAAFFTTDPRGAQLPGYLLELAEHLTAEQAQLTSEIELTRQNVEHIKDIVTMQQNYAKVSGVVEKVKVTDLVEDALRMNAGALARHHVQVVRDYPKEAVECNIERQKVLQILINLIRNAKYACDESGRAEKHLLMQVRTAQGRAQITVLDNGVGISTENLTRIFNHGFTTRARGHGFGLHSGALAAKELGGTLTAASEGPGAGARFVLDLPLQPPQAL